MLSAIVRQAPSSWLPPKLSCSGSRRSLKNSAVPLPRLGQVEDVDGGHFGDVAAYGLRVFPLIEIWPNHRSNRRLPARNAVTRRPRRADERLQLRLQALHGHRLSVAD